MSNIQILVFIRKADILKDNSLQALEKQDYWRVEIPLIPAADMVGAGEADFGPLNYWGNFNKEIILEFMHRCISYQVLFLIPVCLD